MLKGEVGLQRTVGRLASAPDVRGV